MFILLPVIAAALIAGQSSEDEERRRRRALGIGDGDPVPGPDRDGAAFVPVRLWGDEGIWTPVNEAGVRLLGDAVNRVLYDDDIEEDIVVEDLDPLKYQEGGQFHASTQGRNSVLHQSPVPHALRSEWTLYAYVRRDEVLLVFAFNRRGDVKSDDGSGVSDLGSRAVARIRTFYAEVFPEGEFDEEEHPNLRVEKVVVPDGMLEFAEALNEVVDQQGTEAGRARVDGADSGTTDLRDIRRWAGAYLDLREASEEADLLADGVDALNNTDPEEFARNLDLEPDEEEALLEEIEGVNGGWPRDLLSRFNEELGWAGDEASRAADAVENYARRESELFEEAAQNIKVNERRGGDSRSISWEITYSWARRDDDPIEIVELQVSEENARPDWSTEGRYLRSNPKRPGLLEVLRTCGLLTTASEIRSHAGDPSWQFPGDLTGEWELLALVGTYRPTGGEDGVVFLKVAADHGLLPPAVAAAWAPVLDALPDAATLLRAAKVLE